ncbi:MAG: hypothetical protein RMI91_00690 [Gemmatales bacterium]|nr:hypothetical protein [Gemmatales bacterium]MDW7993149.1 hypothetical protein [Gemmatales bacterium]
MPDLANRLHLWLKQIRRPSVLVVGGGLPVDWLRRLDRLHGLRAELTHNLAIEIMRWNTCWLASILPEAVLVKNLDECCRAWHRGQQPMLDPVAFCQRDAHLPDALPLGWEVTSDSIAGQLAWRWRAAELVLLKSCQAPDYDWHHLAELGLVDAHFPVVAARLPRIHWIDCQNAAEAPPSSNT